MCVDKQTQTIIDRQIFSLLVTNVGPEADSSLQAVSLHLALSHQSGSRLPLVSARGYLPSWRASPSIGWYQIILRVSSLPKAVTWKSIGRDLNLRSFGSQVNALPLHHIGHTVILIRILCIPPGPMTLCTSDALIAWIITFRWSQGSWAIGHHKHMLMTFTDHWYLSDHRYMGTRDS